MEDNYFIREDEVLTVNLEVFSPNGERIMIATCHGKTEDNKLNPYTTRFPFRFINLNTNYFLYIRTLSAGCGTVYWRVSWYCSKRTYEIPQQGKRWVLAEEINQTDRYGARERLRKSSIGVESSPEVVQWSFLRMDKSVLLLR